ncbi:hypothetical protein VPFG_00293 [Vibrio phage nt-1]|uniref:Uncharacterized protein n=1 Tax=Vibrio phage nt-1 TaxID=115992 RepID=R9TJL4_9CAUD|nr:hypothetical protein VPFG_00293 [Vibrio phage nt-1]AGN30292.1 hypothetical protein VPFG_00293 [Vibrio phage nt-1]
MSEKDICIIIVIGLIVLGICMLWYLHPHCPHRWEVVVDKTHKSRGQEYGELTGRVPSPTTQYGMTELTKRKHLVIMKCNRCGKIHKTSEWV